MKIARLFIGFLVLGCLSGCAHSPADQPQAQVAGGQGASFTVVAATNGAPLSYQWYFNGTNISGAMATNR